MQRMLQASADQETHLRHPVCTKVSLVSIPYFSCLPVKSSLGTRLYKCGQGSKSLIHIGTASQWARAADNIGLGEGVSRLSKPRAN